MVCPCVPVHGENIAHGRVEWAQCGGHLGSVFRLAHVSDGLFDDHGMVLQAGTHVIVSGISWFFTGKYEASREKGDNGVGYGYSHDN